MKTFHRIGLSNKFHPSIICNSSQNLITLQNKINLLGNLGKSIKIRDGVYMNIEILRCEKQVWIFHVIWNSSQKLLTMGIMTAQLS